jgi:hypothetical protein
MKYKHLFRIILKTTGLVVVAVNMLQLALAALQFAEPSRASNWIDMGLWHLINAMSGLLVLMSANWITEKSIPGSRPYCGKCGRDLSGVQGRCPDCLMPFTIEAVRPSALCADQGGRG